MSENQSSVETEINTYLSNVTDWNNQLSTIDVCQSQVGVVNRFKRDCEIFSQDVSSKENPSSHDIVDFTDRHNMLEIQFYNLMNTLS
jgi:hypothetical protein